MHFREGDDRLQSSQKTHRTSRLAVAASLAFCILVLIGAWQYWLPFVGERAWYEVNDIFMPNALQFLAGWLNEGERWEKLPRFIPYFVLPFGMTLLLFRFLQAAWQVASGQRTLIIVSHEAEDMVEAAAAETRAADAARGGRH